MKTQHVMSVGVPRPHPTRTARRDQARIRYYNLNVMVGLLCINPRNEHTSGRVAGVFAVLVVGKTRAGSQEWRINGRGTIRTCWVHTQYTDLGDPLIESRIP